MGNPHLYFIHGWGIGSAVWHDFTNRFDDYKHSSFLDIPGYADHEEQYTESRDLQCMVKKMLPQIQPGAVLIGWSLGGMVSIEIARQSGMKLNKLILVACSPCFVKKPDWQFGVNEKQITSMQKKLSTNREKVMRQFFYDIACGDSRPRNTLQTLINLWKHNKINQEVLENGLNILRTSDMRKNISELKIPVHFILAENDNLVSIESLTAIKDICPDSEVLVIKDTGHMPFYSRPEEVHHSITTLAGK